MKKQRAVEHPYRAVPDYNILSLSSGRVWGVMTPNGEWTTYGDLTPSERGRHLPTAVLRYHRRETAERIAHTLTKRAGRTGGARPCS